MNDNDTTTHRAPLTPRPDWTMPAPPAPDCVPCALLVGKDDGWDLYWATPEQAANGDYWTGPSTERYPHVIPWPFGEEDVAYAEDFAALGFVDPDSMDLPST